MSVYKYVIKYPFVRLFKLQVKVKLNIHILKLNKLQNTIIYYNDFILDCPYYVWYHYNLINLIACNWLIECKSNTDPHWQQIGSLVFPFSFQEFEFILKFTAGMTPIWRRCRQCLSRPIFKFSSLIARRFSYAFYHASSISISFVQYKFVHFQTVVFHWNQPTSWKPPSPQ